MNKPNLRTFIQNLYSLWVYDFHAQDLHLNGQLNWLQSEYFKKNKWNKIAMSLTNYSNPLFQAGELDFIKNLDEPCFVVFPYHQIKTIEKIEVKYDERLRMPYIVHKKKKLYFHKGYSKESCERAYRFLIEKDQILGGGYLEKAPHCYQTESFKIEDDSVLIDGGTAEGLFTLDNIEKVSHSYLIEADKKWIPALEATFAPYKDKITIINKYLSDKDDETNISLSKILSRHNSPCFVKMDIEGAEVDVVEGAKEVLKSHDNVRMACCTYHYQDDAEKLSRLFDEIGYKHNFSDGYMFFAEYDIPEPPYLRHALIRAQKLK